jgi:hypothetical protein
MQTGSLISGPVSDQANGAWLASAGELSHLSGSEVELTRSGERFEGVGAYRARPYASLYTRLVELGPSGLGRDLFELARLREPLLDTVAEDLQDECSAQWRVFLRDLTQAGVLLDAGLSPARASESTPTAAAAAGGCALTGSPRPHGNHRELAALSFISFLVAFRRKTPRSRPRNPKRRR